MKLTLGSLFDGSGGFPFAGYLTGITPLWASEVEPYPIAVTRSRFPAMKHLGSVTDIHGGEIEPVDIITFGSPCQDLSVAGKRAGLKHEANGDEETTRSGLFMEAVRIIKEMREATNGECPTFALFENVPGAFSSNGGEDFRTVLDELIGIVEPNASVPPVPKAGWAYADSYTGDGWSLAYRVFDAQYWGVPQRRRRIHLVLDLRGERAREVLFEREGVRGYFAQSGAQRQGVASDSQESSTPDDRTGESNGAGRRGVNDLNLRFWEAYQHHGWREADITGPLTTEQNNHARDDTPLVCVPYAFHLQQDPIGGPVSPCIGGQHQATVGVAFQPVPGVLLDDQGGQQINVRTDGKSHTLRAETHGNLPCVVEAATTKEQHLFGNHSQDARYKDPIDVSPMLLAHFGTGGNNTPFVVEGEPIPIHDQATRFSGKRGDKQAIGEYKQSDIASSQTARQYKEPTDLIRTQYIVRRLTPTECARLQGFPDKWGHPDRKDSFTEEEYRFWVNVRNTHAAINGKPVKEYTMSQMLAWYNKLHTDSAEYKMWGNGIALPPALYVMQGITKTLRKQWLDDLLGVGDS